MGIGAIFVWGLRRSGIHFLINWLYANEGAIVRDKLHVNGLHTQLRNGFCDEQSGVAFFNNCGRRHSRRFELGKLTPADFEKASGQRRVTIFGIEDCELRFASSTLAEARNILILRDPLNNLASRLEARTRMPEVFRVDERYIDLLDAYCAEYLGRSNALSFKVVVNYDRFVSDRAYRDYIAAALGLTNVDAVSEVPQYGGGSSFSADAAPVIASLMNRFNERSIPGDILDMLVQRTAVREACSMIFGYDLAERVAELRRPLIDRKCVQARQSDGY